MFVEVARQYCEQVLAGDLPACEFVKQACRRQVDDLAKDWRYRFDVERAEHVCRFIQLLPHVKGEWAGQTIELQPWQVFILTTIFGWVDEKGHRRFKTCYVEIPRKNGKSSLSSAIALYCLTADGEPGAEVYAAGVTRDQSKIVWEDAKRMVERCAGLRGRFGVTAMAHSIVVQGEGSTFKALSRDQGGNLDGLSSHCAIIDELHAHKTRDIFDVLETSTSSRRSPILFCVTTAGFNRSGICYEQRAYALKVLNGSHDDPEYFGIVYTIDEKDDWTDPAVWAKANPNWNVSVKPEDIARKARKAQEMAAAQNNYLTKHLNCWVNADTAWMNMRAWDGCAEPLSIEDFSGEPCWLGLDLATKTDIAALAIMFKREEKYYLFAKYYLPEDAAEEGRNSQYSGWVRENWITTTPGSVTGFAFIEEDIRDLARRFTVMEVAFDPWQASYLSQNLMEDGMPMVEYRQTVQNMSEPMKQLEAHVLESRLIHDGNPVTSWMVSNVVCHTDAKENIYPRKEFPENKIDGVVATIMALGRAESHEDAGNLDDFFADPVVLNG